MSAPSWVRYGDLHGWLHRGSIPAKELVGATFWVQAARVACAAEGGNLDAVQCYDPGVFTVGPFRATAASGALALFLADIPSSILLAHLGPLCERYGLGFSAGEREFKIGLRTATVDDLRRVFLGGADLVAWSADSPEAQRALAWVEAFASMLADPSARRGIGAATAKQVMAELGDEGAAVFGVGPGYEVAVPMRRACACYLAFAMSHPKGAARLLRMAGPDADKMLDAANKPGPWPDIFPQRVGRTRAALDAEVWG